MIPTKQFPATYKLSIARKAEIIEDEPIPAVPMPTNAYPEADDGRPSTIVAIVLLSGFVLMMLIITVYFLLFHKRKGSRQLEKSPGLSVSRVFRNQTSWKMWPRRKVIPPELIIHSGPGGIIHCREPPPSDLRGILVPSSTSPLRPKEEYQNDEAKDLDPPRKSLSRFRLPSLRFTQEFSGSITPPVPAVTAKPPGFRFAFQRRSYLLNNRVSMVVSDTADSSVHTDDSYDKNLAQDEEPTGDPRYNQSSTCLMQSHGNDERSLPNANSSQNVGLVDHDLPPALQTPDLTTTSSEYNRVSRSFTAPAAYVFQHTVITERIEDPSNEPASLTSNFILQLANEIGKPLLDEDLPPPAIMVSPPTASTLYLHRRNLANGSARDVWSPRYRHPSSSNMASLPEYSSEIRSQDLPSSPPPRPPRSPKRSSVQMNDVDI
jgi:hypothetical protein